MGNRKVERRRAVNAGPKEVSEMGSAAIQGELWGAAARDWAELQEPMGRPLWEAMLDAAHVGAGTRLLDAGCGAGGASVLAAARRARVSGFDASEPLLALARERVPAGDFRQGDLEALPYAEGAFDAVLAANSVQYTADPTAAVRELRRVCAAGYPPERSEGRVRRVVVALWSVPEECEMRDIFKAVRDTLPAPPPGEGPFALSMPGRLEGLLELAGLRVVGSGVADCPFEYSDLAAFWRASRSAGVMQGVMRAVGEERLRVAVLKAAEAYQRADGRVRLENRFRFVTAVP
jgi:SAM-dependent methyltransferase